MSHYVARPVPETIVILCRCACHDGAQFMEDPSCCGKSGCPRITYPDRPPPEASSPFLWYWEDQARPRRPAHWPQDAMRCDFKAWDRDGPLPTGMPRG